MECWELWKEGVRQVQMEGEIQRFLIVTGM